MMRTAVVSILLAACAFPGRSRPTALPTAAAIAPLNCVVGDSSVPTRDSLFTVGVQPSDAVSPECRQQLSGRAAPTLNHVALPEGADLRDALDNSLRPGATPLDVVVTTDPAVIEYATRSPAFIVDTLAWNRTYVLVALGEDSTWKHPNAGERDALARDAVRGLARGAVEPFDWLTLPACPKLPGIQRPSVVAYSDSDAVGRQLAERVVALASMRARPAWIPRTVTASARVVPVFENSLESVEMRGRVAAFVTSVERGVQSPCGSQSVAPLVDTRAHVIVRRGSGAAFAIGADGGLWFIKRGAP
jgi:hypothetical protein